MTAEGRMQTQVGSAAMAADSPAVSDAVAGGETLFGTMSAAGLPLCIDLDGTLVKSDTLVDALSALARNHPAALLLVPGWLARGKAALKREVAARAPLDAARLPYNEALIVYLR